MKTPRTGKCDYIGRGVFTQSGPRADARQHLHIDALANLVRLVIGVLALALTTGCIATRDYAGPKQSFNVYVADAQIVYEGTIARQGYDDLVHLLEHLEFAPDRLTITSGGGDADVGIDLGLLVHRLGLDIYVPAYCASSCANYVFTAGKKKVLAQDAFLMWHGGATQLGIGDPPPCVEGDWYDTYFDCDVDRYSRKIDPIIEEWLQKEVQFFRTIGVDQRITVLGQEPEFRCGRKNHGGWYYSITDLERLGVQNIEVLGGGWNPDPPTDSFKYCRVDLSTLQDGH